MPGDPDLAFFFCALHLLPGDAISLYMYHSQYICTFAVVRTFHEAWSSPLLPQAASRRLAGGTRTSVIVVIPDEPFCTVATAAWYAVQALSALLLKCN